MEPLSPRSLIVQTSTVIENNLIDNIQGLGATNINEELKKDVDELKKIRATLISDKVPKYLDKIKDLMNRLDKFIIPTFNKCKIASGVTDIINNYQLLYKYYQKETQSIQETFSGQRLKSDSNSSILVEIVNSESPSKFPISHLDLRKDNIPDPIGLKCFINEGGKLFGESQQIFGKIKQFFKIDLTTTQKSFEVLIQNTENKINNFYFDSKIKENLKLDSDLVIKCLDFIKTVKDSGVLSNSNAKKMIELFQIKIKALVEFGEWKADEVPENNLKQGFIYHVCKWEKESKEEFLKFITFFKNINEDSIIDNKIKFWTPIFKDHTLNDIDDLLKELPLIFNDPQKNVTDKTAKDFSLFDIYITNGAKRDALFKVYKKLSADKTVMEALIFVDPMNLRHASTSLQNDKLLVNVAVLHNGDSLQFASDTLRNCEEVVSYAVLNKGTALEHASKQLQNNKKIVAFAVLKNKEALNFASNELKNDTDIKTIVAASSEYGESLMGNSYLNEILEEKKEYIRVMPTQFKNRLINAILEKSTSCSDSFTTYNLTEYALTDSDITKIIIPFLEGGKRAMKIMLEKNLLTNNCSKELLSLIKNNTTITSLSFDKHIFNYDQHKEIDHHIRCNEIYCSSLLNGKNYAYKNRWAEAINYFLDGINAYINKTGDWKCNLFFAAINNALKKISIFAPLSSCKIPMPDQKNKKEILIKTKKTLHNNSLLSLLPSDMMEVVQKDSNTMKYSLKSKFGELSLALPLAHDIWVSIYKNEKIVVGDNNNYKVITNPHKNKIIQIVPIHLQNEKSNETSLSTQFITFDGEDIFQWDLNKHTKKQILTNTSVFCLSPTGEYVSAHQDTIYNKGYSTKPFPGETITALCSFGNRIVAGYSNGMIVTLVLNPKGEFKCYNRIQKDPSLLAIKMAIKMFEKLGDKYLISVNEGGLVQIWEVWDPDANEDKIEDKKPIDSLYAEKPIAMIKIEKKIITNKVKEVISVVFEVTLGLVNMTLIRWCPCLTKREKPDPLKISNDLPKFLEFPKEKYMQPIKTGNNKIHLIPNYAIKEVVIDPEGSNLASLKSEKEKGLEMRDNPVMMQLQGYFEENGNAYFVTDRMDKSLDKYLKENCGTIPAELLYDIAIKLTYCIFFLHSRGILHRDIKLENFFVKINKHGVDVKLGDWASARNISSMEHTYQNEGTPVEIDPWMHNANEQQKYNILHNIAQKIPPETLLFSPACDIYSLGIVLSTLFQVKHQKPWPNVTKDDMREKLVGSLPDNPYIPVGLNDIIKLCCVEDRNLRPRSEELLDKLLKYRDDFLFPQSNVHQAQQNNFLPISNGDSQTFVSNLINNNRRFPMNPYRPDITLEDGTIWIPKDTRGCGSCALHAILGVENNQGQFVYLPENQQENNDVDIAAKQTFIKRLHLRKYEEQIYEIYIKNLYLLLKVFHRQKSDNSSISTEGSLIFEQSESGKKIYQIFLSRELITFTKEDINDLLSDPNLYETYLKAVCNLSYYFSEVEIEMAAYLFDKRIVICEYNKGVYHLRNEVFNSKSPSFILICHSGGIHFERCIQKKIEESIPLEPLIPIMDKMIDLKKGSEELIADLSEAQYKLACNYLYGLGVQKDLVKAKTLFWETSQKLHVDSLYQLGRIYEEKGNKKQSLYYFELAYCLGCDSAFEKLKGKNVENSPLVIEDLLWKNFEEQLTIKKEISEIFELLISQNTNKSIENIIISLNKYKTFLKKIVKGQDHTRLVDGIFSKYQAEILFLILAIIKDEKQDLFSKIIKFVESNKNFYLNTKSLDIDKRIELTCYFNLIKFFLGQKEVSSNDDHCMVSINQELFWQAEELTPIQIERQRRANTMRIGFYMGEVLSDKKTSLAEMNRILKNFNSKGENELSIQELPITIGTTTTKVRINSQFGLDLHRSILCMNGEVLYSKQKGDPNVILDSICKKLLDIFKGDNALLTISCLATQGTFAHLGYQICGQLIDQNRKGLTNLNYSNVSSAWFCIDKVGGSSNCLTCEGIFLVRNIFDGKILGYTIAKRQIYLSDIALQTDWTQPKINIDDFGFHDIQVKDSYSILYQTLDEARKAFGKPPIE